MKLLACLLVLPLFAAAQDLPNPKDVQVDGLVVDSKAASPIVDCGCQCISPALTYRDFYGRIQGNCNSADSSGAVWCYVPRRSPCRDRRRSFRFRSLAWSYHACTTPLPTSPICRRFPPFFGPNRRPGSHQNPFLANGASFGSNNVLLGGLGNGQANNGRPLGDFPVNGQRPQVFGQQTPFNPQTPFNLRPQQVPGTFGGPASGSFGRPTSGSFGGPASGLAGLNNPGTFTLAQILSGRDATKESDEESINFDDNSVKFVDE